MYSHLQLTVGFSSTDILLIPLKVSGAGLNKSLQRSFNVKNQQGIPVTFSILGQITPGPL